MECISLWARHNGTSCFCTLSASAFMHWTIPTWLHGLDFFRNLFMELDLFLDNNLFNNNCYEVYSAHVIAVSSSRTCVLTQQPVRSAPSAFPAKKIAGVRSQLCSKRCSKRPSSENFLATGGFFERNTYRATALGCFEQERRWTILTFDRFRFASLM